MSDEPLAPPPEPADVPKTAGQPENAPAGAADTAADPRPDTGAEPDTEPDTGADDQAGDRADDEAGDRADDQAGDRADADEADSTGPGSEDRSEDGFEDGSQDADPPDPEPVAGPAAARGRRGLTGGVLRASVLIGVLFALLGFGLAVQVHTNASTSGLASARQDDLVRILDDLSSREDRLRQQIASLQEARRELSSSGDKASVALSEARTRSATLAILAGTAPARGPGVQVTINDPGRRLDAEDLLDAVEELRAAGAEAFQVGSVRIGMSSSFTDDGGAIVADGTPLDPPYVIIAIGDPGTLATALNIPGGVVASVRNAGGQAVVTQRDHLVISALRPLQTPHYASPAPQRGN